MLTPIVRTQGAQAPAAGGGEVGAPAAGPGAPGRGGRGAPSANPEVDFSPKAPYLPRTPADEAKGFRLPAGYRMELVASDPDIISPGAIAFDGNGRMYVSELVGYMEDASADHEHEPVSRVSRWESTKNDGHYDKHTVFVDHLIAPRMILPLLDGSLLVSETDSDDIVQWTDTNGDGVADKRQVVFTGIGQSGDANIEHQKAGLVWDMDNWIYTTYNAFRIRWTPNGFLKEPTGPNGGQWGLATDDDGKPWFVDAGGERGPMNFQYPIEYGGFSPCAGAGRGGGGFGRAAAATPAAPAAPDPLAAQMAANCPPGMENGFEPNFAVVWPAPGISDMQGGPGRIRMPAGNLNHFTAATGPAIVRGDALPADLKGDLLFTEPVGRLIRRAKIVNIEGLTELQNAYPNAEFMTSEDQLFRPVNIANAPDGTVYVADLYHGIIQELQWSGPGSYLRAKIEQYQLDKVATYGRIWRLRYDGRPAVPATETNIGQPAIPAIQPDFTAPRMYEETPAQLVTHLTSPNGWWRDTAQKTLVLKQDKSVVPALQAMVRGTGDVVPRFQAMWTLEGLGALDASLVRQEMKDSNPRMRIQAIRASETLYKAGDRSFADDYRAATKDSDVNVVIQGMLTLNVLKVSDSADVIKATVAANKAKGIIEIGDNLLRPAGNAFGGGGRGAAALTPEQQQLMQQGNDVFNAVCFSCHASDGHGQPLAGGAEGQTMAPPLAGSPRVQGHRDYVIHVLLNGLTGPVDSKTYTEVMVPMGANKDEWVAGIASYIRNSLGNSAGMVSPADVARVRAADAKRKTPWTVAEIEATLPKPLDSQQWTLSASAASNMAVNATTIRGWNSGAAQAPGMWFQVQFAQPVNVSELQFDSAGGGGRGGGGGGGRGAAGRAGAAGAAPGAPGAPGAAPAGAPGAPAAGPAAAAGGFGAAPAGPGTYPRGYTIQTSMDGKTWSKPVATGKGVSARTDIAFTPTKAQFVRITETDPVTDSSPWSISNLRVYETPAPAAGK